jgi:fatty acid synthase
VPDSSDWQVTRKAGTESRVPRKAKLSRTVGGRVALWIGMGGGTSMQTMYHGNLLGWTKRNDLFQ